MRLVLAGASGLLGTALADQLASDGHTLLRLVRRTPASTAEVRWDPARGELDPAALAGADAVICLSGAGVGDKRWTDAYKQTLLRSRVDPVALVARTMAQAGGPGVLLSASAVGIYGDTGDRVTDESGPAGSDFLAQLCVQWEAAADPARAAGIRVTALRTGLVLTRRGGLVPQLRTVIRLGAGGRLGSGRQYLPWITLADHLAAVRFLLDHDIAGPVNVVGPQPVRNAEFVAELARQLHRPAVVPAPRFGMRLVLGELADAALAGQRAVPAALTAEGFTFQHRELPDALRWALQN